MKQKLADFVAKHVKVTGSASVNMKRCVRALVLAVAVLLAAGRANAVEPNTLPADIRQRLQMAFAYISPEGQKQILIAIKALTPARAQQAVMNMRSAPPDYAIPIIVLSDRIRTGLAPADRQRYINGIWGVSRADETFSTAVNQQILASLQNQAGGMRTAPPLDQDQLNRIARNPFRMLNDEKTREISDQGWNALGGDIGYKDPTDPTWRGQAPIGAQPPGTYPYNCQGKLVYAPSPPYGCTPAPPLGQR